MGLRVRDRTGRRRRLHHKKSDRPIRSGKQSEKQQRTWEEPSRDADEGRAWLPAGQVQVSVIFLLGKIP